MERPTWHGLTLKGIVLTVIVIAVAYPFVAVVATSLSTDKEIIANGGLVLWPTEPTLDAYRVIFAGGQVTHALVNSLGVAVVGTAASLVATVMMAYGLSRRGLTGGRFILMVALLSMLFNAGTIPNFLLVKELGLMGTFAALVLPGLISAFNFIVLRSFFTSIPRELIDSATVDGAGDLRVLFKIVLPLSKAPIAVVSLFYAVGYWNSFFNAMLYLDDRDMYTLPLILRQLVLMGQPLAKGEAFLGETPPPQQAIQMAVVVIALVPILLVYPFLQRFFTKGVLTGAIKG
ncbi:ABC transporter permease [Actinorhabdospora filicis]|uniref:ABC transporter permease n=2 Tax=Actinorhabdospora filicis TaxID=1785913 RepID=A0A9W6SRP9_9ACTN|nr:ABC transporter permease [Actinorhabdospora filicis]